MCTRIFGTTILKNLHVGTKGKNIHDLFADAVLKLDVIVGHIATKSNIGCLLCIPWTSRIYKIASTALSICSSPSFLLNEIKARLRHSLQYNSSMNQLQLFIKRQNIGTISFCVSLFLLAPQNLQNS